jgi:hypothetical protein
MPLSQADQETLSLLERQVKNQNDLCLTLAFQYSKVHTLVRKLQDDLATATGEMNALDQKGRAATMELETLEHQVTDLKSKE